MARVLVINPNSSDACGQGIAAAIAPLARPGGPRFDVVSLADGPPAILTWADWHAAAGLILHRIAADPADAYIVACASDPGIEAARTATPRPVFGVFRAAVAGAVARAERFGVIAIVEASKARHRAALRSMGLEPRLAAEVALNVGMDILLDPIAARAALIAAACACAAEGAETVILGCTGMTHHRRAIEAEVGVPVIDPCRQAAAMALAALA
ncbi:MAG: aspartate/glutamate racemase family protein [Acetobacteraceae bacterium]